MHAKIRQGLIGKDKDQLAGVAILRDQQVAYRPHGLVVVIIIAMVIAIVFVPVVAPVMTPVVVIIIVATLVTMIVMMAIAVAVAVVIMALTVASVVSAFIMMVIIVAIVTMTVPMTVTVIITIVIVMAAVMPAPMMPAAMMPMMAVVIGHRALRRATGKQDDTASIHLELFADEQNIIIGVQWALHRRGRKFRHVKEGATAQQIVKLIGLARVGQYSIRDHRFHGSVLVTARLTMTNHS